MEALVIIAVLVLFSMLDAVARKQRQARLPEGEEAGPPDAPRSQPAPDVPRSYHDEIEPELRPRSTTMTSAEEPLPADLWEEIRRLAQGRAPTQPMPAPRPRRPAPPPRRPKEQPRGVPAPAEHPVHRAHANMGRPLAERRTPLERPAQGRHPSADVQAVREMLSAGGASALRRAVILKEVLGPPAAMRGDPYEPGG
jgi:hypothetical protein